MCQCATPCPASAQWCNSMCSGSACMAATPCAWQAHAARARVHKGPIVWVLVHGHILAEPHLSTCAADSATRDQAKVIPRHSHTRQLGASNTATNPWPTADQPVDGGCARVQWHSLQVPASATLPKMLTQGSHAVCCVLAAFHCYHKYPVTQFPASQSACAVCMHKYCGCGMLSLMACVP